MQRRSQLRHTAVDNGLAPLFETHRVEGTQKVLAGKAQPDEFPDARARLARWPQTRADIEANLDSIQGEYTPFEEGLKALQVGMEPACWERLAKNHRARMREFFGIAAFVDSVRTAVLLFDGGLYAVGEGKMTIQDLARLHGALVDVYSAP